MRPTHTAALALLLVVAGVAVRGDGPGPRQTRPAAPVVTPVTGPSWLSHLGTPYRDTSLGRGSGRYGPSPADLAVQRRPLVLPVGGTVAVTGADLYRLNCQGCHRAGGTGAPPEVRSVLPAVEGSSFEMMRHRLQSEGHGATAPGARDQARASRLALYRRIQQGGEKMPPRGHLQESDIDMLYAYLTELAGAGTTKPAPAMVSWARVGENVVKGTCHICHDAEGPRPAGNALLAGATPPLSSLIADRSIADFAAKARVGAPVLMGDLPALHRGRMPVFYYLKDQEIAAAYLYLSRYPPRAK